MKKYDVELLPAAYADLDEIFYYIMVDNPKAADEMLDSIMASLIRLKNFPYSGAPLLDFSIRKFNFKMVNVGPYIVFYRLIDDKIIIYRILHSSRNYLNLLKESMEIDY